MHEILIYLLVVGVVVEASMELKKKKHNFFYKEYKRAITRGIDS